MKSTNLTLSQIQNLILSEMRMNNISTNMGTNVNLKKKISENQNAKKD